MHVEREEVFRKLAEIISEVTDVPIEDIHEDASCSEDIGVESFDIMDINFRIEQVFGLDIESDSFWNLKTLVENHQEAGSYRVLWDGTDDRESSVASGIYFCRAIAEKFSRVNRIVLIK